MPFGRLPLTYMCTGTHTRSQTSPVISSLAVSIAQWASLQDFIKNKHGDMKRRWHYSSTLKPRQTDAQVNTQTRRQIQIYPAWTHLFQQVWPWNKLVLFSAQAGLTQCWCGPVFFEMHIRQLWSGIFTVNRAIRRVREGNPYLFQKAGSFESHADASQRVLLEQLEMQIAAKEAQLLRQLEVRTI